MFRQKYLVRESTFHIGHWRLVRVALLAAVLLLLLAALPSAQAQGSGMRCAYLNSRASFWMPNSGFITGTVPIFLNHNCTPPSEGTLWAGQHGMVDPWNRQAAIEKCNTYNGHSNTVSPFGLFWSCNPSIDSGDGRSGGKRGSSSRSANSVAAPKQQGFERPMTGVQVAAELGMNSGIHFKRLEAFHVGIKSVIDRGVLDVVDVWGNANQYFEVCFPQKGTVVFLDAATAPRTVIEITTFAKDGFNCAAMTRAGTMVLVHQSTAAAPANLAIAQSFIDSTTDPLSSAVKLDNCEVSSVHNLNMRTESWGDKLDVLPKETTVTATARTESWFKVAYEETEGWIAAWLTEGEGECEWEQAEEEDDDNSPALASNQLVPSDEYLSVTYSLT